MPGHVGPQGVAAEEPLLANGALVRLLFEVRLPVAVEQRLGGEGALADGAGGLLGRALLVRAHVHLEHAGTLTYRHTTIL